MIRPVFWLCLLASIPLTIVSLYLAYVAAGVGHGSYFWAWALFPFPMCLTSITGSITTSLVILAAVQFPIYGLICALAALKNKFVYALLGVFAFHSLALLIPFALSHYEPPKERLMDAVQLSNVAEAKKLLEQGTDPNVTTYAGTSALQVTAMKGSIELAKLLLEHGANVNYQDPNDGQTALFYSLTFRESRMTQYLLSQGADFLIKDANGRTVLDRAKEFQDSQSNRNQESESLGRFRAIQSLLQAAERGEKIAPPE